MSIGSYIKLYLKIQKANLDSKRRYLFNFYTGMLTLFLNAITPVISFGILTNYFSNIGGWGFNEILLMYSLWRISNGFYLTFFHHQIISFDRMLLSGDFDKMLIRPHHPLFMFFSSRFNPDGLGDVFTGILGAVWAFYALSIEWYKTIPLVLFGVSGGLIITSVFLVISSTAFWTLQSDGIREVASRFNNTFQAYPINIYNSVIKFILTFILPFAFTGYFPVHYFINDGVLNSTYYFSLISPIIGFFSFAISMLFWNVGLKNYKSYGS
jgi:ABC-2 type transport system permease protein